MLKLFIADDNVEFANYLANVANGEGWQTEICQNGMELVEKLDKSDERALLLVDVNMPKMNGIEAIGGISEQTRPLRIRFMTGGCEPSMVAAKMIAEARDMFVGNNLYKPFTRDYLKGILRTEADALALM